MAGEIQSPESTAVRRSRRARVCTGAIGALVASTLVAMGASAQESRAQDTTDRSREAAPTLPEVRVQASLTDAARTSEDGSFTLRTSHLEGEAVQSGGYRRERLGLARADRPV